MLNDKSFWHVIECPIWLFPAHTEWAGDHWGRGNFHCWSVGRVWFICRLCNCSHWFLGLCRSRSDSYTRTVRSQGITGFTPTEQRFLSFVRVPCYLLLTKPHYHYLFFSFLHTVSVFFKFSLSFVTTVNLRVIASNLVEYDNANRNILQRKHLCLVNECL